MSPIWYIYGRGRQVWRAARVLPLSNVSWHGTTASISINYTHHPSEREKNVCYVVYYVITPKLGIKIQARQVIHRIQNPDSHLIQSTTDERFLSTNVHQLSPCTRASLVSICVPGIYKMSVLVASTCFERWMNVKLMCNVQAMFPKSTIWVFSTRSSFRPIIDLLHLISHLLWYFSLSTLVLI